MRNALVILLVSSVSSVPLVANAIGSDIEPSSNYVAPASNTPLDGDNSLLPVQGKDLALTPADGVGAPAAAPQASVVEAIPTPTAFQAGGVLLMVLIAGRFIRRLRSA